MVTRARAQQILKQLRTFTESKEPHLIRILARTWAGQQEAIKYSEIVEMITLGYVDQSYITQWQKDYSKMVAKYFSKAYREGIEAGSKSSEYASKINLMQNGIEDWIENRGAELVASITNQQRDAINAAVKQASVLGDFTTEELSRVIRPTIGLYPKQTTATIKYFNTLITNGRKYKDAQKLAANYAARQHRYRAMMIARTELAFAYNHGNDEATRQAQDKGYLGTVRKQWLTADDERTCPLCGGLDTQVIGMDEYFTTGDGHQVLVPPLHPHCRCAVAYVE